MSVPASHATLAALQLQLAAVAWPRYELRCIDAGLRRCVATRYWTAAQLLATATIGFLRARNREGCDIYFRPYGGADNAGYVLLDFDDGPCPLTAMRGARHTPCVVVETSPGHQQAWVRISPDSVNPALATAVARCLAARYGADPASAEWRHLGRLAGFTNRKPARLQPNGLPPWVQPIWQCAGALASGLTAVVPAPVAATGIRHVPVSAAGAASLYQRCLDALRLLERFSYPDWSIADYRVARFLLKQGLDRAQVAEALRQGSPGFPRSHPKPDEYLRRTLQAAATSLGRGPTFSRAPRG